MNQSRYRFDESYRVDRPKGGLPLHQ